jgi:hypothetical protein
MAGLCKSGFRLVVGCAETIYPSGCVMSGRRKQKQQCRGPRRKRRNRQQRLQSARQWIATYRGSNIVKGYRRWFGVDSLCAVTELGMLGVRIPKEYRAQLERTEKNKQIDAARRRELRAAETESMNAFPTPDDLLGFEPYVLEHLVAIGFFDQFPYESESPTAPSDDDVPF